jgi:peroxiredoxin
MRKLVVTAFAAALAAGMAWAQNPPKTHLKVGDTAPDIELPATTGDKVKLSNLRGSTVVLAFFPAAFTGG